MKIYRPFATLIVAFALIAGCEPMMDSDCRSSEDCPANLFCQMGECTDLSSGSIPGVSPLGENFDAGNSGDTTGDAAIDEPPHPCPDAPAADSENLVLNEFLANVPMGPDGDANEDGVRHYHDDEFVELVNLADTTIDLTDVALLNDTDVRFTFPEICLESMHAIVVFGGLEFGAEPPEGEGFISLISETWFRYAQGGGRVVVRAADGETIADHSYGSHPDGSLTLEDELHGDHYTPHSALADDDALFSPGTCANGQPFPTGCVEDSSDPEPDDASDTESVDEDEHEDDDGGSDFADSKPSG